MLSIDCFIIFEVNIIVEL